VGEPPWLAKGLEHNGKCFLSIHHSSPHSPIVAVGSLCILALPHELHRNWPNFFDAASAVEFIKFPPYHLLLLLGRIWHAQYMALQQYFLTPKTQDYFFLTSLIKLGLQKMGLQRLQRVTWSFKQSSLSTAGDALCCLLCLLSGSACWANTILLSQASMFWPSFIQNLHYQWWCSRNIGMPYNPNHPNMEEAV
jgi:hypothetical protein